MIKERIIQLLEYKSIPKEEFYIKIGMTSASFRGNAKNTPLNSKAIENILSEIQDVNPIWLLTGQGNMLKEKDKDIPFNQSIKGSNNQMAGNNIRTSDGVYTIDELKKQIENKDNIINNLLKQQELLLNQINQLTSKL